MRLHHWAKKTGVSYRSAWRWFHAGKLPIRAEQLPSGVIIVYEDELENNKNSCILYARVSSHDQKEDLLRQLERLRTYASSLGLKIKDEYSEIGSGLNGHRPKLISILKNQDSKIIIVEHKDRLVRFGFEYIEAALTTSGKKNYCDE